MGWPGSIAILGFTPIFYLIFHLIKGIVQLIKKQKQAALISITISLLFASIFNKIYYAYYNILLAILFLAFSAWVTKLVWKKYTDTKLKRNKITLITLLVINIALICIPDKELLRYISLPKELSWRQLTWDDFKGTLDDTCYASAKTGLSLHYKTNEVFNYPPAIVFAAMTPENSLVKKMDNISARIKEILLEHEQGHFNIVELYARKASDSISHAWGKPEKEVDAILQYWDKQLDSMQDIYDASTIHSSDTIEQHIWTNEIQKMLQSDKAQNPMELIQFAQASQSISQNDKISAKNEYKDGLKEGLWVEYSDSEHHTVTDTSAPYYFVSNYKKGKPCGIVKGYYKDGKLWVEENFTDGKPDGLTKQYYKNGVIETETLFINGMRSGIQKAYDENGKLSSEVGFANGKPDGIYKAYYENGKVKSETIYNKGVEGETKHYDENGNEIK
jgi:antitoxin component YwqK of YwqJK toxin-antitoxin module